MKWFTGQLQKRTVLAPPTTGFSTAKRLAEKSCENVFGVKTLHSSMRMFFGSPHTTPVRAGLPAIKESHFAVEEPCQPQKQKSTNIVTDERSIEIEARSKVIN